MSFAPKKKLRRCFYMAVVLYACSGTYSFGQNEARDLLIVGLETADGQKSVHKQMVSNENCQSLLTAVAKARREKVPLTMTFQANPKVTGRVLLARCIRPSGEIVRPSVGPYEDAEAAYIDGGYSTALRLMRPLADQGVASAQFYLGVMYGNGQGVAQNYAEAMKWYRLAADQGDASAQLNLGVMYTNGQGVPQDYAQAVKWYRLAAEQGYASAQLNLGSMYAKGRGAPKNYVRAHMWFSLAAARGDQGAATSRDEISKRMTPAQIAEAQKLAREWKPTKQPPR